MKNIQHQQQCMAAGSQPQNYYTIKNAVDTQRKLISSEETKIARAREFAWFYMIYMIPLVGLKGQTTVHIFVLTFTQILGKNFYMQNSQCKKRKISEHNLLGT